LNDLSLYGECLCLADYRNNKVISFDLQTKAIVKELHVDSPHGIHIDQYGVIYICTHRGNSILRISDGRIESHHSQYLDYPVSIDIEKGRILIANWGKGSNGSLLISADGLQTFHPFTNERMQSKPHAVRCRHDGSVLVVYRKPPAIVLYDHDGQVRIERRLSDRFDPLAIAEFHKKYLVPNYRDGLIYIFDASFNVLGTICGGGNCPTNLAIRGDELYICEEGANRVLSVKLSTSVQEFNDVSSDAQAAR